MCCAFVHSGDFERLEAGSFSVVASIASMYRRYQAIHPFESRSEKEVSISKGDTLVVRQNDAGVWPKEHEWMIGRNETTGKHGKFPGNYTEFIGVFNDQPQQPSLPRRPGEGTLPSLPPKPMQPARAPRGSVSRPPQPDPPAPSRLPPGQPRTSDSSYPAAEPPGTMPRKSSRSSLPAVNYGSHMVVQISISKPQQCVHCKYACFKFPRSNGLSSTGVPP